VTIAPGNHPGPYEILAPLGAGTMGVGCSTLRLVDFNTRFGSR
jgi:hypothetical protein